MAGLLATEEELRRAQEAAAQNSFWGNLYQGAVAIPSTVKGYLADVSGGPDPSQRMGDDLRKFGGMVWQGIKNDPVGALLDATPIIGEIRSGMDAKELSDKAAAARAAGNHALADQLQQLQFVAAAGAVPIAGTAVRAAKRGAKSTADTAIDAAADTAVKGALETPAEAGPKYTRNTLDRTLRKVDADAAREIPGAPLGVNTPQAEAARRTSYINHVKEGVPGRLWYEDSGGAIFSHAGDDLTQANRFGGGMAVTSGGTTVAANSGFGIKGHNQANLGQPIETGRFPGAMSARIDEIYRNGGMAPGNKIGAYDDQLAIGGGYYNKGTAGQGHRAVHDIWDGEAWGYVNKDGTPWREGFQPSQHAWMDRQMDRVLPMLNNQNVGGFNDWTPGRAQAAAWTGAKLRAGDIKPGEEAFSYKQAIPRSYAQGSRETVPGSNTGHGAPTVPGQPGLLDAPYDIRKAYDDEVAKIIYDEKGRDRIALGMGQYGGLSGAHFQGPGIYEGVNPGRQTQIPVGKDGKVSMAPGDPTEWRQNMPVPEGTVVPVRNPKTGEWENQVAPKADRVDPASRAFMDMVEATYGMGTAQKAAAWSKEFDGPVSLRNAASFDLGGTITNAQAEAILKSGVNMDKIAIVPTPTGARVVNLNAAPDEFATMVQTIQATTGARKPSGVINDGNYFENAWDQPAGQVGQQYLQKILKPDIEGATAALNEAAGAAGRKGFDSVAPEMFGKLRTLDDQFFKEHGFYISPMVQDMRAAVQAEGAAGIEKLVKKLGLSAASVAPLIGAAGALGLLQGQGSKEEPPRGLL